MMKKLLKDSLVVLTFLSATLGFAQEPTLTIIGVTPPSSVTPGENATFTIDYQVSDGSALSGTYAFYLRVGNYPLTGFIDIDYGSTGSGTTPGSVNATFVWPADNKVTEIGGCVGPPNVCGQKDLVSSSALPSGETYEFRFFNNGDKNDFDWAQPKTAHFTNPAADAADILNPSNNPLDGYLGVNLRNMVVNPVLSNNDFDVQEIRVYVKEGNLNVPEASDYKIYNIMGAVAKEGKGSRTINVSDLSSGLYIYKTIEGFAKFVK
ncbi:T9SS type A sorting domain-containing protein [Flavivirga abyssicola]|uniref:T9SS type A sorting domain-containing protein n=1 Tax=Flavivirga abyssicola TaxID=3063533 RepID=UPI0026E025F7|nr:T9SS type A sorting domain-containing protein [Flavivirga sp. MEBiC07777]WVK12920.1 T9SS type A sorting domain-containing protein [Flavivirga sp. MEBiC07777]